MVEVTEVVYNKDEMRRHSYCLCLTFPSFKSERLGLLSLRFFVLPGHVVWFSAAAVVAKMIVMLAVLALTGGADSELIIISSSGSLRQREDTGPCSRKPHNDSASEAQIENVVTFTTEDEL